MEKIFILSVFCENKVGLINRISVIFTRRRLNIESFTASDALVTNQSWSAGAVASPNLYGDSVTQLAGDKGSLAGTLSPTGVPTVTAGGSGTTATGQRTIELSVFK